MQTIRRILGKVLVCCDLLGNVVLISFALVHNIICSTVNIPGIELLLQDTQYYTQYYTLYQIYQVLYSVQYQYYTQPYIIYILLYSIQYTLYSTCISLRMGPRSGRGNTGDCQERHHTTCDCPEGQTINVSTPSSSQRFYLRSIIQQDRNRVRQV